MRARNLPAEPGTLFKSDAHEHQVRTVALRETSNNCFLMVVSKAWIAVSGEYLQSQQRLDHLLLCSSVEVEGAEEFTCLQLNVGRLFLKLECSDS